MINKSKEPLVRDIDYDQMEFQKKSSIAKDWFWSQLSVSKVIQKNETQKLNRISNCMNL